MKYNALIILEDDMDVSVDFFDYFHSMLPVLQSDSSLFCVSAWNDNGREEYVKDPEKLLRSSFFPGLGWMLLRTFWNEVKEKWPEGYWDDWLREPVQRKERDCIRPEISRTYTFGQHGTSEGQFFDKFLKTIKLNTEKVKWTSKDLSYLQKATYDEELKKTIKKGTVISDSGAVFNYENTDLVLKYDNFQSIANAFGLMDDTKAGVPRTAYHGVVTFRSRSNTVYLVPNDFSL